ncbi:hypothetical protein EYF80_033279 [Liparis tanakae]|uniref:Uncharacterized protein n=1 Tax=Liparis tanakae TaxID=230148 RepID=A0A4Z2GUS4_9TELE|nr:hypothetical protein EYF80_033279 [Liparis tanakae]
MDERNSESVMFIGFKPRFLRPIDPSASETSGREHLGVFMSPIVSWSREKRTAPAHTEPRTPDSGLLQPSVLLHGFDGLGQGLLGLKLTSHWIRGREVAKLTQPVLEGETVDTEFKGQPEHVKDSKYPNAAERSLRGQQHRLDERGSSEGGRGGTGKMKRVSSAGPPDRSWTKETSHAGKRTLAVSEGDEDVRTDDTGPYLFERFT